jgi:hypothetical protein
VTRFEPGTPGAHPEREDRKKRPSSLHVGWWLPSGDEWLAEQERMEQKRRRAFNRKKGRKKGHLILPDDHNQGLHEDHVLQIHRMIDAGEETFDVPPLRDAAEWTGRQDGLLTVVGLCPSSCRVNWDAVGEIAEHGDDQCANSRGWQLERLC